MRSLYLRHNRFDLCMSKVQLFALRGPESLCFLSVFIVDART
jgi:hypothetical protein